MVIKNKKPIVMAGCALAFMSGSAWLSANTLPASLAISQVPLTISTPSRPQIMFAIGNSQSMDGSLSGAIMTGSGALSATGVDLLKYSSSPTNFTVPAGFTPPLDGGNGTTAPYTVNQGGKLYDNSPSRLNVAKQGVSAILNAYLQSTDFGLVAYNEGTVQRYDTWAYYMSPSNGFVFTNTKQAGHRYVANPCFQYQTQAPTTTIYKVCDIDVAKGYSLASEGYLPNYSAIDPPAGMPSAATLITTRLKLNFMPFMEVSASADDPDINDVFYTSYGTGPTAGAGIAAVQFTFSGPRIWASPNYQPISSPYPPNFSLSDYMTNAQTGRVSLSYAFYSGYYEAYNATNTSKQYTVRWTGAGPTNAGYVPYTPQVMNVLRGFGYGSYGQSAVDATLQVPMTTLGIKPAAAAVTTAIAGFQPILAPETNDVLTKELKATAGQAATAGLIQGAGKQLEAVLQNASVVCGSPSQYVVLITDGLPTLDLSGNAWPPAGSAAAQGYGVTTTFNSDGTLDTSRSNNQAVIDAIKAIAELNAKGIKTYVVGLGAGVDSSANPAAAQTLKAMSVAGGTKDYFPAKSPQALVDNLNQILVQVQADSQSNSSAAFNSSGLNSNSVLYQAIYRSSDQSYDDWTGDVYAYKIDPATGKVTTGAANAKWSASDQIDTQFNSSVTGRKIVTIDPGAKKGIAFKWNSLATTQKTALNLGDSLGSSRVDYLRGDRTNEQRSGGTFRNRTHLLGDIVNSGPLYVGTPQMGYLDASYVTFKQQQAARTPMLYVGANDGMLHALVAQTGQEKFAYIPNAVIENLPLLTNPAYLGSAHHYYVDGSPQAGDVLFNDNQWHTVLAGGLGAGGKSIYALDITRPDQMGLDDTNLAKSVLWEFTDPDMGLSFSTPAFIRTRSATGAFSVVFGNGYNSQNGSSILYAVDPQTGLQQKKIDLCAAVSGACDGSTMNGLSSVTAVNSSGVVSGYIDKIYAGDLQGNMWVVDINNDWAVRLLFKAKTSSGQTQAITTAPVVTLNPNFPKVLGTLVIFGTGQYMMTADITNNQQQSLYGVLDKGAQVSASRSNLLQQTWVGAVTLSNTKVNWQTQQGWYFDLPLLQERIVADPYIDNGLVIFSSFVSSNDPCSPGGNSYLNFVDYASGGAPDSPQVDINGDGQVNLGDQVNGLNPVRQLLGKGKASSPTTVKGGVGTVIVTNGASNSGSNNSNSNVDNGSNYNLDSRLMKGAGQARIGWWQLQ